MNITSFTFCLGYPEQTDVGSMHFCETTPEENTYFPVVGNKDFLGLYFNLKGTFQYKLNGAPGAIPKRHYNMLYLPQGSFEATFNKGPYSAFWIELNYEFLKMVSQRFPVLDDFLGRVTEKVPALLSEYHPPIPPEIFDAINEVILCHYTGPPREDHYKGKFLDILIACLKHPNKLISGMDMTDIVKVKQAHDLIMKNLQFQHNVSVLADQVGLSKRKLENGFKTLFGTTVYDLIINERMKKAVAMLRDTTLQQSEIAAAVGYTNQNIFYNIFKRKFGHPPSTLRKKAKTGY